MKGEATPATTAARDGGSHSALRDRELTYQRCRVCGHAWLPQRSECPGCLSSDLERQKASGVARLISWVVYHRAIVPTFADRIPYTVGIVELEEGPRLISNIVDVEEPEALVIDQALQLTVREQLGVTVPLFTPMRRAAGTTGS